MKKALALAVSLILIIQAAGCARKPRLDITSFEKHVLSDMELEKKESTDGQAQGYYALDSEMSNYTDAKLDHYSQVYSSATNGTVGTLFMVYSDYQDASEAQKFFNELTSAEKDLVISAPNTHRSESGNNYLLVLSSKDQLTFTFECLYIKDDAVLFASIVLSASETSRLDAEWLKKVDKLFKDLQIHSPFGLEPSIEKLL